MSEATTAAQPTPDDHTDANVVPIGGATGPRPPLPDAPPKPAGGAAPDDDWLERARREAAHIEYECCFHARAQFEACAAWEKRSLQLGVITAVLGALTASTIVSAFGDAGVGPPAQAAPQGAAGHLRDWALAAKLPVAVGALIAGVMAAAMRFLDPQGRATLHGAAGKRYRALADETRQFRTLWVTADATRDALLTQLQAMAKRRAEIHEAAPVIPERAINVTKAKASDDACLKRLAVAADRQPG